MNKNTLIQKHFQKKHLLKMDNPQYQKKVDTLFNWLLTSDHAENDITAKFLDNKSVLANIRTKQDIIVAGIEETEYFLKKYPEISFQKKVNDGEQLKTGEEIALISGMSRTILSLERTTLNILQRMSGIATQTQKFARILSPIHIAATRKTPWMLLDKKAVAVAGGLTHRLNLSDGILIKDNHLQIIKNQHKLNSETEAVTLALKMIFGLNSNNLTIKQLNNSFIEIEVNSKEGARAAIKTFVDLNVIARRSSQTTNEAISTNHLTIMLDNWSPKDAQNFMQEINANPNATSIIFEASGNINEDNLQDWAATGVDIISSGSLTHSTKAADLSLTIL